MRLKRPQTSKNYKVTQDAKRPKIDIKQAQKDWAIKSGQPTELC